MASLLQEPTQAAEAHELVAAAAADPEALARLRALIAAAPRHFESNDRDAALASLAAGGQHGAGAPAAGLLAALLAEDPRAFDAGAAPDAVGPPLRAAPSPKKRGAAASSASASRSAARRRTGSTQDPEGMGELVPAGEAPTLETGLRVWLRWDDPSANLHDKWLAATVCAQPVCEGEDVDDQWSDYSVLEFDVQQVDMAGKAFDLTRYAKLKRLRFSLTSTLVQSSPQGGGSPGVSPTPTAATKKQRSRPTKLQHAPAAVSTDSAATVASRLRKHVDGVLERAPDGADQLSSAGDHDAIVSASDCKKIVDDVISLKSSSGGGRIRSANLSDGQSEDAEDDAASTIWGVEVTEWHTVLLVLDRFMQDGVQRIEAGDAAGGESVGYMDAALIVLHIATLANRPKKLLISETIDTVLLAAKRILDCIVFPAFNAALIRPDQGTPDKSGSAPKSPAKIKRATAAKAASSVSQVVHCLGSLCMKETLEDAMICSLSSLGISTITMEGASAEMAPLQASSVELLCMIAKRYRDHRTLLFNDTFEALPKLANLAKKSVRQFRVSDDVSIQTVSALFLGLVHASIGAPPAPSSSDFQSEWDKSRTDYAEAQTEAKSFLSKFIKKCSVKKEDGDVRVVLDRFINDICTVLNWPAWPAAEPALRSLALMMTHELKTPVGAVAMTKAADSSYRGFLVDMVGVITCTVYRQPAAPEPVIQEEEGKEDEEDADDAALRIRTAHQTLMISHLRSSDGGDSLPFLLNLWLTEGDTASEDRQKYLSSLVVASDGEKLAANEVEEAPLSMKSAQVANVQLAGSRDFLKMKPMLLERILALFQDTNISLRSKAMKVLSGLMEVSETVFAEEPVKAAVRSNLYDAAVSVREAAVDMVGKAMALNATHSSIYLDLILERVLDAGKSVRKRCVRILYELLCRQPMHPSGMKIMLKLVSRSDDDDSIREIVLGTFRDLWFNPEVRFVASQVAVQQTDTQAASIGPDGAIPIPALTLPQRVKQILELMAVSTASDRSRLVVIFNALLGRSDREGDARKFGNMASLVSTDQVAELCGKMCDQLIEVLLREDEAEEDTTPAAAAQGLSVRTCCILAMHIFCQTGAEFLVGHMTTLQPYLKLPRGASSEDTVLVQYAAHMIYECLPIAQNLDQTFKEALAKDLFVILSDSAQLQILHVTVKCLCALFQHAMTNDKVLRNFMRKILVQVTETVEQVTAGGTAFDLPGAARKGIFILGCLCRNYCFDVDDELSAKQQQTTGSTMLMSQVAAVCLRCAKPQSSESGRRFAVGALGHIACRNPNMLLQDEPREIMEAAMHARSSPTIKQQVLKSLSEVLVDEERKNMQGAGITAAAGRTGKKFTDTADDSKVKTDEMGLSGGLMQRYLPQLLTLSHDTHATVRFDALNLIRVILRQGLVHPIECVPHIVALEGDKNSRVRTQAGKIITYLDEKHHGLLLLRSVQGVAKSYEFQRRVFGEGSAFVDQENTQTAAGPICAFAPLYLLLRGKKAERNQFVSNLLSKMTDAIKDCNDTAAAAAAADGGGGGGDMPALDLNFVSYIATVLSSLPYAKKDEVMAVLSSLIRSINLHGDPLEESLEEAMTAAASAADASDAETNDKITSASAHLLRPLQHKCTAATAVCMLVHLKRYIQTCYGISDSQVASHNDVTGRLIDVPIARRTDGQFQMGKDIVLKQVSGATEEDSVLWTRYEQLKTALKDDGASISIDHLAIAANTPNGSSRGRAGATKRGRSASKGSGGKAKGGAKPKSNKKRPKRRKRLSAISDDSESESDDDSDFEG